jgi:nitrogen-specific signal transduction histidine kinase
MAGTLIDISMRKLVEAERSRVLRAEAESHAKSSFLASMSHEMRTPLNAILGYAQLLGHDSGLNLRQRESLDTILRSGDHLLSLINEVLDLAQIESGHMKVTPTEVDLRQLLIDLERMFRLKVTERGVGLRVDGLDQLPRSLVTDARKVRQVLINLLGNAVKFTERGGISVRVTHQALPDSRRKVSILVEDTGCGIEADKLGSIFESFVQADAGSRTLGAGLGLAVSLQLAKALEGGIEATSALGEGSRFIFHFVAQCAQSGIEELKAPQAIVVGLASSCRDFPVLVVDSQSESRAILGGLLGAVGFALREATHVEQALSALATEAPRVVLWVQGSRKSPVAGMLEPLSKACREHGVPLVALLSSEAHALEAKAVSQATLLLPLHEQELFDTLESIAGVEFLRSGDSDQDARALELEAAEKSIRALPEQERMALQQAIEDGFTDLIEQLIRQVKDTRAANRLSALSQNFDYARMLALLDGGAANPEASASR